MKKTEEIVGKREDLKERTSCGSVSSGGKKDGRGLRKEKSADVRVKERKGEKVR